MTPERGQALWTELHDLAWTYPETASPMDQRAARVWLAEFARRVREERCSCATKWDILVRQCHAPLGSRAEFYWWSVAMHDAVNQALGKPLMAPEWSLQHQALKVALPF